VPYRLYALFCNSQANTFSSQFSADTGGQTACFLDPPFLFFYHLLFSEPTGFFAVPHGQTTISLNPRFSIGNTPPCVCYFPALISFFAHYVAPFYTQCPPLHPRFTWVPLRPFPSFFSVCWVFSPLFNFPNTSLVAMSKRRLGFFLPFFFIFARVLGPVMFLFPCPLSFVHIPVRPPPPSSHLLSDVSVNLV